MIKVNILILIDVLVAIVVMMAILHSIYSHETADLPYLVIILLWTFRLLIYDYECDKND